MKKFLISSSLFILFLTSFGLVKPPSVQAAEGGPAGKIMLRAASGPKAGQVTLTWAGVDSADNYHLIYGTDPKNLQFGALNIGTNNVYTVGKLNPATKYYFALVPVMNNVALYTSEWVSAWSMGGGMGGPVGMVPVSQPVSMQPATQTMVMQPMVGSGPVGKQWLWAKAGPKEGEVTLYWRHADDANNYHLVYGTEPGKFKYGAINIGWVNWFTVRSLVPGMKYYFALVPVKNDVALYTSNQVAGVAKMNIQIVQTTPEAVMQPKNQTKMMIPAPTVAASSNSTDAAVPTVPVGN